MRSLVERQTVRRLLEEGHNDCEIARRTGIPRSTVRDWRRSPPRRALIADCFVCADDARVSDAAQYAYLLGLYLGDGYIVAMGRAFRLRIYLDVRYPGIVAAAADTVRSLRPAHPVALVRRDGCVAVSAYWKHWPCVFPQHGPGRKHERAIVLEEWQLAVVDDHPRELLRGLIHSDGWRGTNRVTVRGRRYAYPRYNFDNRSDDIRRIFCNACDAVGVEWRRMGATTISVARRDSVRRMDEFVGPKT